MSRIKLWCNVMFSDIQRDSKGSMNKIVLISYLISYLIINIIAVGFVMAVKRT